MEASNWRKKYLLALLTSPLTLFPLVGGASILMLLGTFGIQEPWLWIGSGGCMLFGTGVFLQRLAIGSPSVEKKMREEAESEVVAAREAELDVLQTQLEDDDDPRTDKLLVDLRILLTAFREGSSWRKGVSVSSFEILSTANQMFEVCVNKLRETLELYNSAKKAGRKVKKAYLEKREKLIQEIQDSIDQLTSTLRSLEELESSSDQSADLVKLNEQLTNNLEIARRTEARVRDELYGANGTLNGQ